MDGDAASRRDRIHAAPESESHPKPAGGFTRLDGVIATLALGLILAAAVVALNPGDQRAAAIVALAVTPEGGANEMAGLAASASLNQARRYLGEDAPVDDDALLAALTLRGAPDSALVEIEARAATATRAARIANAVAAAYLDRYDRRAARLREARAEAANRLAAAREAIAALSRPPRSSEVAAEHSALAQELADAITALHDLTARRDALTPAEAPPEQASDRLRQWMRDLLRGQELERRRIDRRIAETEARVADLRDRAAAARREMLEARRIESEYDRRRRTLEREAESAARRESEAREAMASMSPPRLLRAAAPEGVEARVAWAPALTVLGLGGAPLAALWLMLRARARRRLGSADALSTLIGGAPVAAIAFDTAQNQDLALRRIYEQAWAQPNSALSEQARYLTAALPPRQADGVAAARQSGHVALIASPRRRDGRTSFAVLLAHSAARMGYRVLIVEADLRRPRLRRLYPGETVSDLGVTLCGGDSARAMLQDPWERNLHVMFGGEIELNPADLLASSRFGALIEGLRRRFDLVLLDTPPMLETADARFVARTVDSAFLIARAGADRRRVAACAREISDAGARIIGGALVRRTG